MNQTYFLYCACAREKGAGKPPFTRTCTIHLVQETTQNTMALSTACKQDVKNVSHLHVYYHKMYQNNLELRGGQYPRGTVFEHVSRLRRFPELSTLGDIIHWGGTVFTSEKCPGGQYSLLHRCNSEYCPPTKVSPRTIFTSE